MPIIPQLAMGIQMPQLEQPDFLRLMLGASQIQQAQQQAQMRQFQMAQALRAQQQEEALQAFIKGRLQPTTPAPSMADQVPPSLSDTYARPQVGTGIVAPPDTVYTRAPASMQPNAITAPPQPQAPKPIGWQELLPYGEQGLQMAGLLQKAQASEAEAQKDQMDAHLRGMEYTARVLAVPDDEASYQATRADLLKKSPGMASMLPPTFDRPKIDALLQRLHQSMVKAKGVQYGTEPRYYRDPRTGEIITTQMGTSGEAKRTEGLQGLQPLLPTMQVNKGTSTEILTRPGGLPTGQEFPTNVGETARLKAGGTTEGQKVAEYDTTLPQRKLEAENTLTRLDEKRTLALEKVTQIMDAIKTSRFPTAGRFAALGRFLGVEGPMDVNRLTRTLRAQIGLDELVNLKTTSKAGLGQVSDEEGRRLESAVATINPDEQTDAQLWDSLHKLAIQLQTTGTRVRQEYQKEFVQQQGRPGGSSTPSSYGAGGQELTEEDIAATLANPKNRGKSREDVINDARKKGFTWQGR